MTGTAMDRVRTVLIAANGAFFAAGLIWTWLDHRPLGKARQ